MANQNSKGGKIVIIRQEENRTGMNREMRSAYHVESEKFV